MLSAPHRQSVLHIRTVRMLCRQSHVLASSEPSLEEERDARDQQDDQNAEQPKERLLGPLVVGDGVILCRLGGMDDCMCLRLCRLVCSPSDILVGGFADICTDHVSNCHRRTLGWTSTKLAVGRGEVEFGGQDVDCY